METTSFVLGGLCGLVLLGLIYILADLFRMHTKIKTQEAKLADSKEAIRDVIGRIEEMTEKLWQNLNKLEDHCMRRMDDIIKTQDDKVNNVEDHCMRRMDDIVVTHDMDHGKLIEHVDSLEQSIHRELDSRLDKLANRLENKKEAKPKVPKKKKEPTVQQLNS